MCDSVKASSKVQAGFGTLTTSSLRFGLSDEDKLFKGSGRSVMKFARNVHFQIKSGKETEFNNLFEKEVVPMLRRQNGFQEEVTLVNPKGAHFISLWDNRKNAETYETAAYPQVLAKLTPFIEGTPKVETYETASSYARS
jgi:quinol monooxygenase YgiN